MSDMIRFIGDVHGRYNSYLKILEESPYPTIQVGDFGVGFGPTPFDVWDINIDPNQHKFIRGNHDNPKLCKDYPAYIPDGSYSHDDRILYVGGAGSIDRMYRTPGLNWWVDEQLSMAELDSIVDGAWNKLPEIIISHECPDFIADAICNARGYQKYADDNRTRMMLSDLYTNDEIRKPKLHIFGHWHVNCDFKIHGTRFICLNELSYIDIDIDNPFDGEIDTRYCNISQHTYYLHK